MALAIATCWTGGAVASQKPINTVFNSPSDDFTGLNKLSATREGNLFGETGGSGLSTDLIDVAKAKLNFKNSAGNGASITMAVAYPGVSKVTDIIQKSDANKSASGHRSVALGAIGHRQHAVDKADRVPSSLVIAAANARVGGTSTGFRHQYAWSVKGIEEQSPLDESSSPGWLEPSRFFSRDGVLIFVTTLWSDYR